MSLQRKTVSKDPKLLLIEHLNLTMTLSIIENLFGTQYNDELRNDANEQNKGNNVTITPNNNNSNEVYKCVSLQNDRVN